MADLGDFTVTTSPTLLLAANAGRLAATLVNKSSTVSIYFSASPNVDDTGATVGNLLNPQLYVYLTQQDATDGVYAVTASGTTTVHVTETP